jgi:hypothetical protein
VIVRELVTKLGFKTDTSGIKKANLALKGFKVMALGAAGALVAAGGAILGLAKKSADFGDEMNKLSEQTGISTDQLQQFKYVASQTDTSIEGLAMGFKFLAKNLYAAREGSKEAQDSFKAVLGKNFNAKNIKDPTEAMLMLSDAFSKIKDPIKKAALLQKIYGKSGLQLAGVMSKPRKEIEEMMALLPSLNLILTKEQLDAGDQFNDKLGGLKVIWSQLTNIIGAAFLPELLKALDGVIKFVIENKDLIKSGLVKFLKAVAATFSFLWDLTIGLGKAYDDLKGYIEKAKDKWDQFTAVINSFKESTLFKLMVFPMMVLVKVFEALYDLAKKVTDQIDKMVESIGLVSMVKKGIKVLNPLAGMLIGDEDKRPRKYQIGTETPFKDFNDNQWKEISDFLSSIKPPSFSTGENSGAQNTEFQISQKINVTVPAGEDPQAMGNDIAQKIKTATNTMWRDAQRAFSTADLQPKLG